MAITLKIIASREVDGSMGFHPRVRKHQGEVFTIEEFSPCDFLGKKNDKVCRELCNGRVELPWDKLHVCLGWGHGVNYEILGHSKPSITKQFNIKDWIVEEE
jgi:hypothetical protein